MSFYSSFLQGEPRLHHLLSVVIIITKRKTEINFFYWKKGLVFAEIREIRYNDWENDSVCRGRRMGFALPEEDKIPCLMSCFRRWMALSCLKLLKQLAAVFVLGRYWLESQGGEDDKK